MFVDTTTGSLPFSEAKELIDLIASSSSVEHVIWSSLPPKAGNESSDDKEEEGETIDGYLKSIPSLNEMTTRVYTSLFYHNFFKNNLILLQPNHSKWAVSLPYDNVCWGS